MAPARRAADADMQVLVIAPLPPPTSGHSVASRMLVDDLARNHRVDVVDLSEDSGHAGQVTTARLRAVARVLRKVWRARQRADTIYLTISESIAGNLKDLCIYFLCASRLPRMYIHLHGGTIGRRLFDRHPMLRRLNRRYIARLAGVIVTGQSHVEIFRGMIDDARIHVVPNCAQEPLFVPRPAIAEKFSSPCPIRLVYIGAMTRMKGYDVLTDAFLGLPDEARRNLRLDFAGRFDAEEERARFLDRIAAVPEIRYHGIVDGDAKARLFAQAHVFCLPTAHLEGQPIAILEAYASGCVVVSTGPSGIRDVFTPGVNGFEIQPRSVESLRRVLEQLPSGSAGLLPIASRNREIAEAAYRPAVFTASMRAVMEST